MKSLGPLTPPIRRRAARAVAGTRDRGRVGNMHLVTHMKTTIEIADALFRRLKRVAAARGTTLKALIEAAIRESLEQESRPKKRFRLRKHTVKGKGLHPGIREGSWTDIPPLIYEGQGG